MTRLATLAARAAALLVLCCAATAHAQTTTLRVMLHPYLAAAGTLPAPALARLTALIGTEVTPTGFTRNGAVNLSLPIALDTASTQAILNRLRNDRDVLWAQAQAAGASLQSAPTSRARSSAPVEAPGNRLMLRLAPGVAADWSTLGPELSAAAGMPITPVRQIGDVWVLQTLATQPAATLDAVASSLQRLAVTQYAEPVRRVHAMLTPDDPLFPQQWALTGASGIGAEVAWGFSTGSAAVTVAVVDTGITPHPELDGRVLPGYDFISDPGEARDGDGRDPNPLDQGDWTGSGDCGGARPEPSSWHGTFVAGLIGANANNGVGIAGVDWNARILPVRVLGKCGGTTEDVFAGMMWAAGVPIDGVPPNPYPARVINMSLGGYGSCDGALQEAVDTALAQGAVVVVAAGNEADYAQSYNPAGCSGVIAVAAGSNTGALASYSNYGQAVALMAPGGDFNDGDAGLILSLSNDGATVPGNPAYGIAAGTSAASPLVAGTVSLMIARNANLTAGRVQSILQGTSRAFAAGSFCSIQSLCGAGMLDAGMALAGTVPAGATPPANAVAVVEYYRSDLDHYFITADPSEIQYYDTVLAGVYVRTGGLFYAYPNAAVAPPGALPVCRYAAGGLINSNYFSAYPGECEALAANSAWFLQTSAAFWIQLADATGACTGTSVPVYRFFNNRNDANQRHTVDLSERRAMINRAWVPDAPTPNGAVWCSPT
ncbi:MAG: S8 family peptidase [Proteobacteria bacterium]|nr:S8 family peptidase [Pseudomonadota bacterium]